MATGVRRLQLHAALTFLAAGKDATSRWDFLTDTPQPKAPHMRLRYANESGEDVTLLLVHAGVALERLTGG